MKKYRHQLTTILFVVLILCFTAAPVNSATPQIDVGGHIVGLYSDGTVGIDRAVGGGGISLWGMYSEIQKVAAGEGFTLGLTSEGTVFADGDINDGGGSVEGWHDIKEIAAGCRHAVGLKSDGTVVATGDNTSGQCDVENWKDIQMIAAAEFSTVGLKTDGSVVAVGKNDNNQCDVGDWGDIQMIAAGWKHTVGLKSDGSVVAVGEDRFSKCEVGSWKNIKMIAAGMYFTVGLKNDGSIIFTGPDYYPIANLLESWNDIQMIAAGQTIVAGLKHDGKVLAAGDEYLGQRHVEEWSNIQEIDAGCAHTVGLKSDGTLVATGYGHNQCEVGSWSDIQMIAVGNSHTIGLKSDGSVIGAGANNSGQCDVDSWSDIQMIATGYNHTVGLKTDGTVIATGYCGNTYEKGPCNVDNWEDIQMIAAGDMHTIGLKFDGSVIAAGDIWDGYDYTYGPCDVENWRDIHRIFAGYRCTVGLKNDGSLLIAEDEDYAYPGNPLTKTMEEWKNILMVDVSSEYAVGVKSDGSINAIFGRDSSLSSAQDIIWPDDWDNIKMVATGSYHTVGLKTDGTVISTKPRFESWDLSINDQKSNEISLYFPHVASNENWETEITIINEGNHELSGNLKAYNREGVKISERDVILVEKARRALTVGKAFSNAQDISYITYSADSSSICGYTKFYQKGKYRVAVPAVQEINTGDIYVPHIASNDKWWTGLALVNTTASKKTLNINFSNGKTKQVVMAPGEHTSFNIKSLFGGTAQPDIESAEITGGSGVIGLELFSGATTLSGVLLKDETTDTLYFPHVASNDKWWTGIAAYNPSSSNASLTVTPYAESGSVLDTLSVEIAAGEKYLGNARGLSLPGNTAWFKIDSSQPLNGFELFGTTNGKSLAGYSTVDINRQEGVFPKLDHEGWTGIAFVNTSDSSANVDLSIYDDEGYKVADKSISLAGHEKVVNNPEDIFGGSITAATYMKFSSNRDVVGFQLNGTTDGMMLDGLPGM